MGKCVHCTRANYCRKHSRIQFVERDSLHPVMWINPHIQTYYRPMNLPMTLCIKSIFQINNETINVWSHLLGFIYITFMQYWCAFHALPSVNAPTMDYVVMAGSMLCSQICMALSSAYHTFGCQNAESRQKWLKADLFGVSLALLGIYLSGIYTSFYRFPEVQRIYSGFFAVILAIAFSIPLFNSTETIQFKRLKFNKANCLSSKLNVVNVNDEKEIFEKRYHRRIGVTHIVYIGLALFGLYPTWHWLELHGGFDSPHVVNWLPTLITLFALVGLAFVFYITLIPERFYPGKFDLVGCSHQWWHLLILVALVYWHDAGIQLLTHYHTNLPGDYNQNIDLKNSYLNLSNDDRNNITL